MALGARGPRLFEEVKADRAGEAFDDRGRAVDELGVDVTHLVILVPGRGGWRRCRADDSDLCRRVSPARLRPRLRPMRRGRPLALKTCFDDRRDASPVELYKHRQDSGSVH